MGGGDGNTGDTLVTHTEQCQTSLLPAGHKQEGSVCRYITSDLKFRSKKTTFLISVQVSPPLFVTLNPRGTLLFLEVQLSHNRCRTSAASSTY